MEQLLLIEDEMLLGKSIQHFLSSKKYECTWFKTAEEGMEYLQEKAVDLIISDITLPGKSGMDLLNWVAEQEQKTPVILITAHSSVKNAVEAMKKGAVDYISKPLDLNELEFTIRKALKNTRMQEEITYYREKARSGPGDNDYRLIPYESFQEIDSILQRMVMVEENTGETPSILITGETGTGKGALVRHFHSISPRAKGPFIEINCTAIPESMFESELFGHEKGSFTGAGARRVGLFELANQGALFLDEIGHAPPSIQAKLLKAIEDKKIRRIGGSSEISLDVRLLAATNADIEDKVHAGEFREDLFHRLALIPLKLPALRDCTGAISSMVEFFLKKASQKYKLEPPPLTQKELSILEEYSWPGNIRELKNEIERAVLLYNGKQLNFNHLIQLTQIARKKSEQSLSLSNSIDSTSNDNTLINSASSDFQLPSEGLDLSLVEGALLNQAFQQGEEQAEVAAKLLHITQEEFSHKVKKNKSLSNTQELWGYQIPSEGVQIEAVEKIIVQQALTRCNHKVATAARLLNISRDILRYRLEKLNL